MKPWEKYGAQPVTDKPWDKYKAKPVEPSMLEKAGDEVGAFFSGKGGTVGESVPIIGPLGRRAGEGFRAVVEGGLSDKETIPEAYGRIRGENDAERAKFSEEHPVADVAKKLYGGLGGAGAVPTIGAGVGGALGAGARIAGSYGSSAADAALSGENSDRVKQAGTMSAGIQAGLEAVPVVGHAISPLAKPLAEGTSRVGDYIKSIAAKRAVKAALGNNPKAYAAIGEAKMVPTGKALLDEGVVGMGNVLKPVGGARDIAKKARGVADKSWEGVEKTFQAADQAGVTVNSKEVADEILAAAQKIDPVGSGRTVVNQLLKEAEDIQKMGEIPLSRAQELKNKFKWKVKDPNTHALGEDGNNIINSAFGNAIKTKASSLDPKFAEGYQKSGSFGGISTAAKKQADKLSNNRSPFSLTDYIAGASGGGIAASITGDPRDAGAIAFVSAAANNLARTRGNSAVASSLNKLANVIKSKPDQVRKFYDVLEAAAKRGQTGLAVTHQMLLNTNPEYRQALEGEK